MRSNRKSKFPEWDGTGNKFEWILEQVRRMRDRPANQPWRLYVNGVEVSR